MSEDPLIGIRARQKILSESDNAAEVRAALDIEVLIGMVEACRGRERNTRDLYRVLRDIRAIAGNEYRWAASRCTEIMGVCDGSIRGAQS